jgi:hypothetical protein
LRGGDQDDRIHDLRHTVKLADKVGEARRVDKVDFMSFPLDGQQGGAEADFAALLFWVKIRGSVARFNCPDAVGMSSDIEEMLCESRFAAPAMSRQRYIAYLFQRVLFHRTTPSVWLPAGRYIKIASRGGEARRAVQGTLRTTCAFSVVVMVGGAGLEPATSSV